MRFAPLVASLFTVTFISSIKRKYIHTFYNFDTAKDYNRKFFLNLREDQEEAKASVMYDHPDTRQGWGDELLRPWCLASWSKWETERPAWFTDAWIEVVPNDYIPYDWQVKYKKTKGRVDDPGMRRRSSLQQVKTLLGGTEEDR